jgi:hypothetical protein
MLDAVLGMLGITTKHFSIKSTMKTPLITVLNTIGLTKAAQKALYAASVIRAGLSNSPQVILAPRIPAIAFKPAIIAQTAKPARAATALVPAAENTTGVRFGELYLNSPAIAAGVAIPAIPDKPASLEVVGVAQVLAVPEVPAVIAPAVVALKGWENAIQITKTATLITIEAYLPFANSPAILGGNTSTVDGILEITPPIQPTKWLDAPASAVPTTDTIEVDTLEKYLYKQALALRAIDSVANTIVDEIKIVNGSTVSVKHITLKLTAVDYDPLAAGLQLGKL